MNQVRITIIAIVFMTPCFCFGQNLADAASEQSTVSKMLKTSGNLFVRESHDLAKVETARGSDIECDVMIIKNLLAGGVSSDKMTAGVRLSVKEEYSERSAFLDIDEAKGLLASLKKIGAEGLSIIGTPLAPESPGVARSSEIHYTTKEQVSLGAFARKGSLMFALKVSSLADWAILTDAGRATLESNLEKAIEIAKAAGI
jgi:hypothetical protein